ncbi:MAG: hypothetical protein Q8L97_10205 [Nitrosomonas sp.]|uniref:hypothetical protein n=1 Tax=Nitrosomonas sp. TaxID=42353 RepID=UPI00272F7EB7|nr:hypothetical protein [Nitrosomonas sp.]MDP1550515.1 hypothetical protein [Nitrosomonas sp.]
MAKYSSYVAALDAIIERVSSNLPVCGQSASNKLHFEIQRLRTAVNALHTLNSARSPTETEAAHIKKVSLAAKRLGAEVATARTRVSETTRLGLLEIDERIAQKIDLRPNGYAAEIRAAFRNLDYVKQISLLDELASSNRGPELAAIIKAPTLLTGIDPDLVSKFTELVIQKHAPAEFQEQFDLMEVMNSALTAVSVGETVAGEFLDPVVLAKIEAGESAANEAEVAFTNSLPA